MTLPGKVMPAPVGANEGQAGVKLCQEGRIVDAGSAEAHLMRIPGGEIVGVIIAAVARDAEIKHRVLQPWRGKRDEGAEHLATLMEGDARRQAVRRGDIVLGVDPLAGAAIVLPELHPDYGSAAAEAMRRDMSRRPAGSGT